MKTSTCISSAPVMPAVWPQSEYLESLRDIASRPDREDVLKEFFKETYV